MTVLQTERLRLRPMAPEDEGRVVGFFMSERARMAGGQDDRKGAWRTFAMMLGHWQIHGFGLFAVTMNSDDAILGMVGPWFPEGWPEHEIGWLLLEEAEGRGIAFEAAAASRDHAYRALGWNTAVSYIDPENARSIALAERMGCTRDDAADQPTFDFPAVVYRHPAPGGPA